MSTIALIRPHDWTIPLFVHIFGAMLLVGALTLAAVSLIAAWRSGSARLIRLAYMSLFYGALPGYIVFRGRRRLDRQQGAPRPTQPAWIGIGYGVSDFGVLLLIISLVVGGISVRQMNRGGEPLADRGPDRHRPGLARPRGIPGRRLGDDHETDVAVSWPSIRPRCLWRPFMAKPSARKQFADRAAGARGARRSRRPRRSSPGPRTAGSAASPCRRTPAGRSRPSRAR